MLEIASESCRIAFEPDTGGLSHIANRALGDECLKGGMPGSMPFRLYTDLTDEFRIDQNDKCQLVFQDMAQLASLLVSPENCLVSNSVPGDGLALCYRGEGFQVDLDVAFTANPRVSDWGLRVTNTGDKPRDFLTSFPYFDGLRLGPNPAKNLATAMDQGGVTVPAWERPGGVLGESNQMSMQWHAIWDPDTKSALAVIFMDPEIRPKRILLREATLELQYFPPVTLDPGESYDLPPARVFVYEGDWRPAALLYRSWYQEAFPGPEPPEWFRRCSGYMGAHFKKDQHDGLPSYHGQFVLDSFRDLPRAHLANPVDNMEYAFYCQGSAVPGGPHTDGDHVVRDDLGGVEALRDGIAAVHRLGLHATIYIDGFIVWNQSQLAKTGKAAEWAIVHRDGTNKNPYVDQGFIAMCPGCAGWQDHLAESAARLVRDTGADGVRLDSLGFYYIPCYNPAHNHETPFGYNDWLQELLRKVRDAVLAVRPDALLLTEGAADWVGKWFHGALTSRCPRDLSFMRLAVKPFHTLVYATGPLWGSLSGCAGGTTGWTADNGIDWNWPCASHTAHEALVWGEPAADPPCSDPEIVTRLFEGEGYSALVAARPASQDPLVWPRSTTIATHHRPYAITLPGLADAFEDAAVCDVETLTWSPLSLDRDGDDAAFRLESNWVLVVLRRPGGPSVVAFDALPTSKPGETVAITPSLLAGDDAPVTVQAPGLEVSAGGSGETNVAVPDDAFPGRYGICLDGAHVLGVKRFLEVPYPKGMEPPQPIQQRDGEPDNR